MENIGTNIMLAWRGLIPGEVGQALETPPKSPALGRDGKTDFDILGKQPKTVNNTSVY